MAEPFWDPSLAVYLVGSIDEIESGLRQWLAAQQT